MFDPAWKLALGFITGILFGFLLQKGRVAKFHTIIGQFLLKDWTVVKIMGTAVVVGAVGIFVLLPSEAVSLHLKDLKVGGVIVGALLFGGGMAIFGYCPGTGVTACGEGRRDAMVGVVGMFFGAAAYVLLFPWLTPLIEAGGKYGEISFPQVFDTSPWWWVAGLVVAGVVIMMVLERKRLSGRDRTESGPSKTLHQERPAH